jgi:hypothetical protein
MIVPETRASHLDLELLQLGAQSGYVKDAPGTRRNGFAGTRPDRGAR